MTAAGEHKLDRDRDLLRILSWVAWSDGDVSAEEKELLLQLGADEALAVEAPGLEALEALIPRIEGEDERQLAVKLAYQLIRISRRPGDTSSINAQEKVAYRRLIDGLGLEEAQIQEAEWAAEQDLAGPTSLLGFLASRFKGLGAWPDATLLEAPGAPRL
ncbi:hypothetical protein [Cyanobium sp. Morenito 9A2]|uniref:hypothetical protein n=1 Tax=Cyanobium sp. Morenito 9A2 TaxID=2823718 RepID=UPI0020CC6F6B|nr:hypothetical protein [Cyanobium sp. Morenito 9A2]MCP9850802.1 hypothetical protein [Cyanobium sp. Morenito 9A2]